MDTAELVELTQRRIVDADTVLRGDPTRLGSRARDLLWEARCAARRIGGVVRHFTRGDLGDPDGFAEYRKTTLTRARRVDEPFTVDTPEGRMVAAEAGSWLALDANGDPYCIRPSVFAATYEPARPEVG